MRLISILASVVASVGLMGAAQAAVDEKPSDFVLCKQQKNVRTIKIMPEKEVGTCKVTYSKSGVEEVVGANSSTGGCKSILKNIQNNLETSKWSCRSVRQATVTTSSEVSRQ